MAKVINLTENQFGEMMAYHGAGADFDKFNHKKYLSTGAGSQVFGWGTYVTSDKTIANGYASATDKNGCIKDYITCLDKGYTIKDMRSIKTRGLFVKAFIRKYAHLFIKCGLSAEEAERGCRYVWDKLLHFKFKKAKVEKEIQYDRRKYSSIGNNTNSDKSNGFRIPHFNNVKVNLKIVEASLIVLKFIEVFNDSTSVLYEVEIPDDNNFNYINWHGPLTNEQVSTIIHYLFYFQNRFKYDIDDNFKQKLEEGLTIGGQVYYQLTRVLRSQKAVSLFLMQCGFDGIKYVAGTRWGLPNGAVSGSYNYVIFDANKVKIVNKTKV